MSDKIDNKKLIEAYNSGESMYSIAKKFNTYPTTIKRILVKNNIELRHDAVKKGDLTIKNGEKLIGWIKSQERLVTKNELAQVLGKTKLSPSYFIKYPELGQYIQSREQKELQDYSEKLYKWLRDNNIKYKPNDRTKLKVSVTALLLEKYSNIILQIAIKPKCVSTKKYFKDMTEKKSRARELGMTILFLNQEDFKNLDMLKKRL